MPPESSLASEDHHDLREEDNDSRIVEKEECQ